LKAGIWRWRLAGTPEAAVRTAFALARAFDLDPDTITTRIEELANRDPEPGVRLRAIECLLATDRVDPARRDALARILAERLDIETDLDPHGACALRILATHLAEHPVSAPHLVAAEYRLVNALKAPGALRDEAIAALAVIGEVSAVPALAALEKNDGRASEAIQRIQSRSRGTAGSLAMVAEEEGALAIASADESA
jgi:hypothetical protein